MLQTNGSKEEFIKTFMSLCSSKAEWQVWEDLITAISCAISAQIDEHHREEREQTYLDVVKKYEDPSVLSFLYANIIQAFDNNPEQDYLGTLYQSLNLSSHYKGQFFSPMSVCRLMATAQLADAKDQIEEKGFITVHDPACGAGATLVASANELKRMGINYQTNTWFVGWDVDPIVAKMCYIQLSLLGCPGYIGICDTLANPITGSDVLLPNEGKDQELWFMPMSASEIWVWRRKARLLDVFFQGPVRKAKVSSDISLKSLKTGQLAFNV